ncbi:MAG: hypothetical protein ABIO65_00785 [Nitrospiria bacterium]
MNTESGDGAPPVAEPQSAGDQTVFQLVQKMNVAEKVRFAFRADKEGRALLLKDTSKLVVLAVLNSPKITEQEVEMLAKSRNVSDEILRVVARKREWVGNYGIKLGLVSNPKTPVGIALTHLASIKTRDLGFIGKDRGVSEAIRGAAQRLHRARQEKGA